MKDREVASFIQEEKERQIEGIELIASENYVSDDVYEAMGSVLTNKYAEGYPNHRYYGGCEVIDKVEQLAIDRACKLFNAKYANVQPHSGSQANRAVIEAVCNVGDTILSLHLDHGGHLTHGSPVSFSGKYYNIVNYHTKEDGYIDYEELKKLALEYKPKLIIAGASAYSREWDYKQLVEAKELSITAQSTSAIAEIALNANCILMFDMAHTAGLIAAGLLKNPVEHCDIVTSTTHKTLRGPRGGIILMRHDFENPKGEKDNKGNIKMMSAMINSSVFPGNQGGPLENIIAAKAVCFYEALQPEFKVYQSKVKGNAHNLAESLKKLGYKIVSNGTDNHEFLVDIKTKFPNMTGKEAETRLGKVGITVNKNMIPNDTRTPFTTSGIRIGTPAITSRGISDMEKIAKWIDEALSTEDENALFEIKEKIEYFCKKYPLRNDV